jgi:hypothetical protein
MDQVSEGVKIPVTEIPLKDKIILIGPPGVGKTEIIREKAEEEARKMGRIFVDLREADEETLLDILQNPGKYYIYYRIPATHVMPEDIGIPRERKIETKNAVYEFIKHIPPLVLAIMTIPDIPGTLFIDELCNVNREDQLTMYYAIIQEKEAGFTLKFSKNLKVVAAANPPEWGGRVVVDLPPALQNRLTQYEVLPPSVDEWISYMIRKYGDNWTKECAVYLKMFPTDILAPPKASFQGFPTPRSWTEACALIEELRREGYSEKVLEATAVGRLGPEVGFKLSAVFKVKLDLEAVLRDLATKPEVFEDLDLNTKILVLSSVASRTPEEISNKLRKFFEYLLQKHRELLTALVMIMKRETKESLRKEQWFDDILKRLAREIAPYYQPRK